jgi:DNA polymerase/3'-5' exonuclease PolX
MTDFRNKMIDEFNILKRVSATESAGVFKVRSYEAAIKTIQGLPPIRTAADIPEPKKGDGLGTEIRKKMAKIIETGSLDIAPEVRAKAVAIEAFQNIYGVGPKKAEDLIAAGYTTIDQLRAAITKDAKLLNKNQQIGLRYYEQLLTRIPRKEMDQHAAVLMTAKPASLEGVIVGSYRRGKPDSGDIDMLIRTATADVDASAALAEFVTKLKGLGYIKEVLAMGDHKCMAICDLGEGTGRRLDLLVTPPTEFPFAVFYFTGSDTFNVTVRSHALSRGFTLNEHGITQVSSGRSVSGVKTEKDIFSLLKLQWREPTDRTGPEAVTFLG